MKNIVFRVDSSTEIGTGHVMRCLTLAEELQQQGAQIRFISRHMPEHIRDIMLAKGLESILLTGSTSVTSSNDILHAHWLGTSQQADAKDTLRTLSGQVWDWMIVDHYALDVRWESRMRSCADNLMIIDDLADRNHDCDLLLDQNLYEAMEYRYTERVPLGCIQLLGPRHALLRKEFLDERKKLRKRDGTVQQILVFLGGTDPANVTSKVLAALTHKDFSFIHVDVVVGEGNRHKKSIESQCKLLDNIYYHQQIDNIAELMTAADIAIGAGGSSAWERCLLGLPSLVVVVASNQLNSTVMQAKQGSCFNLGTYEKITANDIEKQLRFYINNPKQVYKMSNSALGIMNGYTGIVKIAHKIMGENNAFS